MATEIGEITKQFIFKDKGKLKPPEGKIAADFILTLLETQPPVQIVQQSDGTNQTIKSYEVPNQILHSDVDNTIKEINKEFIFIGLLALTEGTTNIRVSNGSHKGHKPYCLTTVELNRYQYFVAHPFLIHSGCAASAYNVRLHFYHGLPSTAANETHYPEDPPLFNKEEHYAKMTLMSVKKRKRRLRLVKTGSERCY